MEELALIAKEQIKLPKPDASIETYLELVHKVDEFYAIGSETSSGLPGTLSSASFVGELASMAQKDLMQALAG